MPGILISSPFMAVFVFLLLGPYFYSMDRIFKQNFPLTNQTYDLGGFKFLFFLYNHKDGKITKCILWTAVANYIMYFLNLAFMLLLWNYMGWRWPWDDVFNVQTYSFLHIVSVVFAVGSVLVFISTATLNLIFIFAGEKRELKAEAKLAQERARQRRLQQSQANSDSSKETN